MLKSILRRENRKKLEYSGIVIGAIMTIASIALMFDRVIMPYRD